MSQVAASMGCRRVPEGQGWGQGWAEGGGVPGWGQGQRVGDSGSHVGSHHQGEELDLPQVCWEPASGFGVDVRI